ncbi:pectate lyase [Natrinema sp. DC36]|uniref:pectate lyase n=1 Tax=Natrinema sp. DC36 TaxID=2878680 RepID=UPI001CF07F2B|nr:pectate lyase [Natrinema sp. DC36]
MASGDSINRTDERGPLSRRRLLALSGVGLAGGLAGCSSSESDSDPTDSSDSTDSGPSGTETETGFDAVLAESPGSSIAPADGFADTSWLDGDAAVVKVTNLEASGEGSLRWALTRPGSTIVIFEVGGVIDLEREHLELSQSETFVAGQTAPSPGITLIRGAVDVNADNVILQHLRVRPGDDFDGPTQFDGINNGGGSNVVVDHCSVTWATDENLSTSAGPANSNISYTNNLVAECLADSLHPKGVHPYGSLVNDESKRVLLGGNCWANNLARTPRLKGGTTSVVASNVMYNFERATNLGGGTEEETLATITGNYYRAGPNTPQNDPMIGATFTDAEGSIEAYIAFNTTDPSSMSVIDAGAQLTRVSSRPLWPENLSAGTSGVYDSVLETVGARPADRTEHDERVLTDVRERTGDYIDSQSEVGGYPDLEATERTLDVPDTGRAEWLAEFTAAVEVAS